MNNFKNEIIADIQNASKSIKIAVSWMTDSEYFTALNNKRSSEDIDITIILSDHVENRKYSDKFIQLIKTGIKVFTWGKKDPIKGNFMHCKFYIIDDLFSKSGSFNWSFNASNNAECLDEVELNPKLQQFAKLLNNSLDFAFI